MLADQLRALAGLVEWIETNEPDIEVHSAELDGLSLDNDRVRGELTVMAPIDEFEQTIDIGESDGEEEDLSEDVDPDADSGDVDEVEESVSPSDDGSDTISVEELESDAEEESVDDPDDDTNDEIRCDIDDCEYTSESERGISIHQTHSHEIEDINTPTADEISQLREERDWTQADLADELGIANSTIGNWETGWGSPSDQNAKKLRELIDGEEEATERVDTAAVDLQDYGVGRRELVDALEGSQTIHHIQRELGITRGDTRELLDDLGMLDRISSGCAPLSFDDAKDAVKEGVA